MSKQEVLKIIKDNFTLWVEPNYGVTLQFQQNNTMTPSEYNKLVKYFGTPKEARSR